MREKEKDRDCDFLNEIKSLSDQEEEGRERKKFKGKKKNPNPLFSCVWDWRKTLTLCKVFFDGFSSV